MQIRGEPLAPVKGRLLNIDDRGSSIKGNSTFAVNIFFENTARQRLRRFVSMAKLEGIILF